MLLVLFGQRSGSTGRICSGRHHYGKTNPVYWRELRDIEMENKFLLDVRNPDEYSLGSLPGAVNIPLDELRDRLAELPKDKMILYLLRCRTTGYLAYRILTQHEFDKVRNLSGGLKTYRAATAPIIIREENGNEIDESPEQQGGSPQVGQPAVAKVSDTTVTATAAVTADALATPLKQFG